MTPMNDDEAQLIELAGPNVRKVRTAEGAQFYGLPIGSPITQDIIAAKKAEAQAKGVKAPGAGALTGGKNKGSFASAATKIAEGAPKAGPAPKPMKLKVKKSSLTGNKKFKLGKSTYSAPNGSKLIKPSGNDALAYVLTPDGQVHAFNEAGEIETDSKTLFKALAAKFEAGLDDDPNYNEVEFDASAATYGIENMKTGSVLTDPDGTPQFTKQADGTWKHDLIGAVLDEKDIQPLFDNGELIPAKDDKDAVLDTAFAEPEAKSFAEMSMAEATAALEAMPEGTAVDAGNGEMVKQADGKWGNSNGADLTSAIVAFAKNVLKIADDKKQPTEKAQKSKDGKAAGKAAPTVKMPKIDWEVTYPGDGEFAKQAKLSDFTNAGPGDKILVEHFDADDEDHEEYTDLDMLVAQEDGSWIDDTGKGYSADEVKTLAQAGDTEVWKSDQNTGNVVVEEPKKAPAEDPYKDLDKAELKDTLIEDGTLLSDEDSKDNKIKALPKKAPLVDLDDAPAPTPEPVFKEGDDVTGGISELVPGDKVTKKYIPASGSGTKVPDAVFTKQDDGKWLKDGGAGPVAEWVVFDVMGAQGKITFEYGDTAVKAPKIDPKTLKAGDAGTKEWAEKAPAGAEVQFEGASSPLVKQENGSWTVTSTGVNFTSTLVEGNFSEVPGTIIKTEADPTPAPVEATGPKKWAASDKITSVDDLNALPTSTILSYTKKDGGLSTYVKLSTGDFLTPSGNVLPANKLKNSAESDKFTVKEVPVGAPESAGSDVPNGYIENATITKFGHLKDFAPGTTVKAAGSVENHGIHLVKQEDGTWTSEHYGAWSTEEFSFDIEDGKLFFVSAPAAPAAEAPALDGEYQTSDVKEISFDSSGLAFSTEDLKGALDALEGHSGFQIAYAFKNAQDNVFADKSMQDKLKAWGKDKYPLLPPKKAAVQILKDKLGIKTEDTSDEQTTKVGKMIDFGSHEAPTTTATGLTGGSYTQQDVQDAIDILNGFSGKLFKNELNKKGNPLGALSPNDLVGFDKDKTKTKQKFIDLLQQKLDSSKVEMGGPAEIDTTELADWEKELLAQGEASAAKNSAAAVSLAPGDAVPNEAVLKNLPVGTGVIYDSGHGQAHLWTKTGDDEWKNGDATVPTYALSTDQVWAGQQLTIALPKTDEDKEFDALLDEVDELTKTAEPSVATLLPTLTVDYLDKFPLGTTIKAPAGYEYTKVSSESWKTDNDFSYPPTSFVSSTGYTLSKLGTAETAEVPNADVDIDQASASVELPALKTKFTASVEVLDALPTGTEITFASQVGTKYWKSANGKFSYENIQDPNGAVPSANFGKLSLQVLSYPSTDMSSAPSELEMDLAGKNGPKVGDEVHGLIDSLPAGSTIQSSGGTSLTKTSTGDWLSEHGVTYDSVQLKSVVVSLTLTHLPADKQESSDEKVQGSDVADFPVGTKLQFVAANSSYSQYENFYTKVGFDKWSYNDSVSTNSDKEIAEHADLINGAKSKSHYKVVSKPDATPGYASTPAAVIDKTPDESDVTEDEIDNAVKGDLFQNMKNEGIFYVYDGDGAWIASENGSVKGNLSANYMKEGVGDGWLGHVKYDGPEYNKSGLIPGKYSSGGKAYMVVKADGTGVYVNTKGAVSKMTAAKVTKNHEAGMNLYSGMPDTIPAVGETVASSSTPKKKAALADLKLEDGTYYSANPNDPKATVYVVTGDTVNVFKPKTSSEGFNNKIGQKPDTAWAKGAATGAKVKSLWSSYTKKAEGWTNDDTGENVDADFSVKPYWGWYDIKITSHGMDLPTATTQAKIQTAAKKGQILDKTGTSVVPDGYAGDLSLFGVPSNVFTLLQGKKILDDSPEEDTSWANQLKIIGLALPASTVKPYVENTLGEEYSAATAKSAVKGKLDALLSGLDTDLPESDASKFFNWNSTGDAIPPESLSAYVGYSASSKSAYIKAAAAEFGGGGIIGQHYGKMDTYEKGHWIAAFKDGNFAKMYSLEVEAATAQGKPHASGYLHPGYTTNTETHKVAWGAAVNGEVSALAEVKGDWSSTDVTASMEEINNYLISAQMQNPTHLTSSEKREWVEYHRGNHKQYVDNISIKAKARADAGETPLSKPPVWTDDVKPAKSYAQLFENSQFPTNWSDFSYKKATDYVDDNPELKADATAWLDSSGYNHTYGMVNYLTHYFQGKQDEADALALIPVYTKKPHQKVKKGTHPIFEYSDQYGNDYFFKPRADTKLDKYRSEAEHLGNELGRLFGFKTAKSQLLTLDGNYGQLQQDVGGVSDLMGIDYGSLSAKQIGDVASEHVLDWLLDNDDTKGDNAKVLPDGSVVGIDKGRAFKHYGAWNGLAANGAMDTNAHTIYSQMFEAIRNGQVSKETADAAYLQMQKRIKRMQKTSDDSIKALLAEGMKNRESYDLKYSINGKTLPANFDGLQAAVLDRRDKLADDFEKMWAGVYADASYGDLPEAPDSPLGDVISGLSHPELHKQVFEAKITGKTAMIGGAHVIGGTALTWTDKYKDGSTNLNGEMFLGPKKQQEVLDYLVSKATNVKSDQSSDDNFSIYDGYKDHFTQAAKTINHHAIDGEYNMEKVDQLMADLDNIDKELDEWTPTLTSNTTYSGEPAYKFSTGKVLPMTHVDQYKLMLDSYVIKGAVIKNAYEQKIKATPHFEAYQAVKVSGSKPKYTSTNGDQLIPTSSGYFFKQASGVTHLDDDDSTIQVVKDSIADGETAWVEIPQSGAEKSDIGITVVKNLFTNEKSAKWKDFEKVVDKDSSGGKDGSGGHEYEITLPTGEKIYYRNGGNTNTAKGQQGKLMFRADGTASEADVATALERIQDQLNAMGITTEAADEHDAELTYWREMYGVLENRKHSATDNLGKTYKEMQKKVKEVSQQNTGHFLEELSASMDPAEEVQYWRDLWSIHHKDKVDKMLAEESYLPKFDHHNLQNPELETGKPYWERFDVTDEELEATNSWLMLSTGGDPWERLKTGGLLSAEERLRQLDNFTSGGYGSASQDQQNGSSHNIYTRIMSKANASSYGMFISPRLLRRTRTYSFGSDNYGKLANRKTESPGNPLDSIKQFSGNGGNETMLPHSASLLDTLEVVAFDNAEKRNEAIQELKKLGIEKIRGLAVEDRLVMHSSIAKAIEKVKQQWKK